MILSTKLSKGPGKPRRTSVGIWYKEWFDHFKIKLWSYDDDGDLVRKHDTTTMSLCRMVLVRKPQRTAETSAHVGIVGYTEMKELSASYSWFPSTLLHQIIWFLQIESQIDIQISYQIVKMVWNKDRFTGSAWNCFRVSDQCESVILWTIEQLTS